MRRQKGSALTAPLVTVRSLKLDDHEDWYTPKVLKIAPLTISVTMGEKAKGRVRCVIEECEWERSCVELRLIFEKGRLPGANHCLGMHSNIDDEFGSGDAGTFTRKHIDWLIDALIAARDEADRRGLFTPRSTPVTVEQALADSGGAKSA